MRRGGDVGRLERLGDGEDGETGRDRGKGLGDQGDGKEMWNCEGMGQRDNLSRARGVIFQLDLWE